MADTYNDLPLPISPDAPREDRRKYEDRLLGFSAECHKESEIGVRNTEGWSKVVPTMQAVNGVNLALRPTGLSHSCINEVGRLAEVMRAELTDVKPSAEYKTYNDQLESHAQGYGKMWTSWYYNGGIDRKMGGVIDYALVAGSGYAMQIWNKFTQKIDIVPYDGRDVTPFRALDNTIESCAGLFTRREMSVNAVKAMFPHKAQWIVQDRSGVPIKMQEVSRTAVMDKLVGMSPHERAQELGQPQETRNAGMPIVDLFYFYLNDVRVNDSPNIKLVGDWDMKKGKPYNNYSYKVGLNKPLYPKKRLIIFTRTCVLYDGPNIYWHGQFPVSKYTLTPWQWTWLGHTPLWDILPLQDTLNRALRAMDDHIQKVLRPPVKGDRASVSATELRAISEMMNKPGAQWLETALGNGVEMQKVEQLDPIIKDMISLCLEKMAERCGVRNMSELMGLNQMPEGQTIDKLMFATRPEMRSRSRMLEIFYREQGMMFLYNAAQFISTREKFAVLGPGGMTVDEYDFDPGTFIPNPSGDPMARRDEADNHLKQFQYYVAPSSLLKSSQTQDQMMAMALFDKGALDIQSLLERLDWPNAQQVLDRLMQQKQVEMQMAAASQGMGGPGGHQPTPPIGGYDQGRPASNEQAPSMKSNGDMQYS